MHYQTENWPLWDEYETLYARFRKGRPESELVDLADVNGKEVLSLCGGSDKIAEVCLERGAKIVMVVDSSKGMMAKIQPHIEYVNYDVHEFLCMYYKQMLDVETVGDNPEPFDVVFCRQAINYWFSDRSSRLLFDVMSPGGVFIFNTMNRKVEKFPGVREYKLDGRSYVEVNYMVDDMIYHLQACDGCKPHLNAFRWITSEEYHNQLEKFFDVEETIYGPASIYVCKKK